MNKKLFAMLLAAMPIAGFVACDDDDDNNNSEEQQVSIVSSGNSECLGSPYGLIGKGDTVNNGFCDYTYDAATGTMKLIVTTSQNCAVVPTIQADFDGNNINVSLDAPEGQMLITPEGDTTYVYANCNCLYSDTLVLNNLTKDNYNLNVVNNNYKGSAEINLSPKKDITDRIYLDAVYNF